jgi:hypothetical protein
VADIDLWLDEATMRARLLAVVLLLGAALCGAAVAARAPLVPAFIQALIAQRSPQLAYVPTRIAAPSFRYAGYKASGSSVSQTLANRAGRTIVFTAIPYRAPCAEGKQKSFQLAGNKVYWAQLDNTQTAWRCVSGANGGQVRLAAATTLQPTQFADVGLGTIVASALRVRLRD